MSVIFPALPSFPLPPREAESGEGRGGGFAKRAELRTRTAPPTPTLPTLGSLRSPGGREQKAGARKVAADFEALFVTQLLRAAHAAKLADDPLAGDDTSFRDLQDRTFAEALVRQSPLGVAKLLTAKR